MLSAAPAPTWSGIHHEREDVNSEVNACVVSMVLETRNADHVQKIKDELTAKGYSLLDA